MFDFITDDPYLKLFGLFYPRDGGVVNRCT